MKNNKLHDEKQIHVIAEAGTNHNGSLIKAKELALIASESNADSVKFQIIFPDELYLPGKYEYGHYDITKVLKIRRDTMLKESDYDELYEYCLNLDISFSSSVFDLKGLNLLMKYNPEYIKIASCDLNNIRFLRQVAEKGKRMVLSTGMSTLKEIDKSLNVLAKANITNIVLMHCVSVYPLSLENSNLSFIDDLKRSFDCEIGFSDHSGDSIASCIALEKGATWFEKHFTQDRKQQGFDHAYALEADEFKKYVSDLQKSLLAISKLSEKLSDDEIYTKKRARRSLYASKSIEAGRYITNEDVLIVRPEGILSADMIDVIVGEKLKKSIEKYQPYSFEFFEKDEKIK